MTATRRDGSGSGQGSSWRTGWRTGWRSRMRPGPRQGWCPRLRACVLPGLLAATAGCPRSTTPAAPSTVAPAEAEPASLGPDVFVQATGRGATEDEAYAAARAALAEAVLGDATWAERLALELHRRGEDPQRVTPREGGVEVAVGLTRARVSVALSELDNGEPPPQGPAMWQEPVQTYLRAHAAAQACQRRAVLFEVECESGQTAEADAVVAELLDGVVLSSAYPDGVPVDAEGRPLRDPVIFALWRGVPLADLPLRVEAEPAEPAEPVTQARTTSDAQGRARIAMTPGAVLAPLEVRVDTEALLGPHGAGVPRIALRIEPRAVSGRRWALVITRGAEGAAAVVKARMQAAGRGAPVSLPARDVKALRATPPDRLSARVAALADAMTGSVDLVLVLAYDTRFASRMGGGRVWYEAEGTLRAVDAWTGEVRAETSATVRADGVGDAGADAAARTQLAEALVGQLLEALPPGR